MTALRFDKIWTVARKDLSEFRRNKYVMYSVVLMPLLMGVVLPIIYLAPFAATTPAPQPHDLGLTLQGEPLTGDFTGGTYTNSTFINANITDAVIIGSSIESCNVTSSLVRGSYLANTTLTNSAMFFSNIRNVTNDNGTAQDVVTIGQESSDQTFLVQFIGFLMMFFIIIPVVIPTVIASYSFVGEKLGKSLEPLLATPTTDAELLAGKTLSIFLPCMAATWLAFIPFVLIVDYLATPPLGYTPLPDLPWIVAVFLLAPLFCILSIALSVLVSSKVNDVRASQQIGALIVLPVVLFFVVVLVSGIQPNTVSLLLVSLLVLAVDAGVFLLALKTFNREKILVSWK